VELLLLIIVLIYQWLHPKSLYGDVFSSTVPPKPPRNILHFLSQLIFDGESEICTYEHALHLWRFCGSHNITDGNTICKMFTLTFAGPVKKSCETFLATSIHTSKQFMLEFLHAFENYDYDGLCAETS
jgi:hypothetical protein